MDTKKVLIVDDEIAILNTLKEVFIKSGYEVLAAESAETAIEMLKNTSAMVMFLDLQLPGMNGIDLCREIRKSNHIAIIHALTGYVNIFGLIDCRQAGFDDFFTKPVAIDILLEAAEIAFNKLKRWRVDEYNMI